MPKREDHLLVQDIQECFKRILEYTKGLSYDDFLSSQLVKDAVVRNFEVIGEASNHITEEFKSNNLQVEWRDLIDFRNKLIHGYFGVDYEIVWYIVKHKVQEHLDFLETIKFDDQEIK